MKRFAALSALVLVLLALGGLWWVTQRLDASVASAIEQTGSQLLGVDVSVGGVEIDLAKGSASVRAIRVANPRGEAMAFSKASAFSLGEITVGIDLEQLDLENLATAPIPLTLVRVGKPEVNAEVTPGGINLEVLRRRIGTIESPSEEPAHLQIDRFEFAAGSLRADTSAVGGEPREVALPSLELRNLRGSPEAIGERVLDAFLAAALRQTARDRLSAEVDEQLDVVKEKASKALRSLLGVEETEE